jgi:peptidoglycan/LPS O-acetylase OafA/YrhL
MKKTIRNNIKVTNQLLKGSSSYHLDFIRGIAAFLVLLNHFRNIFFVTYSDVENQSAANFLMYSFTGLGHQAVIIFFVLSGLFISKSVIKSINKNSWSWRNYLVNRLTRLYIVLFPALILGFILDSAGLYFFDYSFFPHDMIERISFEVFLGNIFYLQGFAITVFGTNDPLWSLSFEFWYYLLFPAILLIFMKNTKKLFKLVYLILVIGCLFFIGKSVSLYFLVWLMGLVVLITPSINIKSILVRYTLKLTTFVFFVASLGISRLGLISHDFLGDLLVSGTFSILVYATIHLKTNGNMFQKIKEIYFSFAKKISSFSYTLYLIHFPLLIFTFALFDSLGIGKMQPNLINYVYSLLTCSVVVFISYLISLITENKTSDAKALINSFIASKSKIKVIEGLSKENKV